MTINTGSGAELAEMFGRQANVACESNGSSKPCVSPAKWRATLAATPASGRTLTLLCTSCLGLALTSASGMSVDEIRALQETA